MIVPANKLVNKVYERIRKTRFGVQKLEKYNGRPNDRVKVGTVHRAKGLEFKVVFLPNLTSGLFPPTPHSNQTVGEVTESRELAISQLFVAMTRARDELVVLYDGSPSEVIAAALDRFEQQEPIKPQKKFW